MVGDAPDIRQVALMTVVGLPENLIRIMTDRARKLFPDARIAVLDLARDPGSFSEMTRPGDGAETFGTIADFLSILTSTQEGPKPPQPLPAVATSGMEARAS
jgi:hypothetical protein